MPGGFSFTGAAGGGSSRQQPTYVWDLLPYSRRGVGQQQQQQQLQQQSSSNDTAGVVASSSSSAASTSAAGAGGNAPELQQQQPQQQQQQQQPRQLTESEASQLEQLYRRKVRESHERYELVAAFRLRSGRVHALHVYRSRVPFQLTERRRKLLKDYYSQGCQDVVLYVNQAEFEHYMPLSAGSLKKPQQPQQQRQQLTQTRSVNGLKSFLGIS